MCRSAVSVSRAADDQRSHRATTVIQHAAHLVTGARMTALDDSLDIGLGLGRLRRAVAVAAESGQRELDALTGLGRDLPAAVGLRDQPHLTADVSGLRSHRAVTALTTFRCRLAVTRTRYDQQPTTSARIVQKQLGEG